MKHGAFPLIDAIDRDILRTLELDARRQNQDVAATIGLSASACLSRVKRLEKNGVIRRYLTDIDLSVADPWIELWREVILAPVTRTQRLEFETRVAAAPEIIRAYQIVGRVDCVLEVAGPDASVWPELLRKLDPDARLVANALAQLRVRVAKPFSGSPQLKPIRR